MNYDMPAELQNTSQMSLAPQPPEAFNALDKSEHGAIELMPVFSGSAFQRAVAYPVIVELWKKKEAGRVKREWLKQFTPAERKKIASYYGRFYRWHLISGVPERVMCHMSTLQLLQRAVVFFASV